MALPADFGTGHVTGTFVTLAGDPVQGYLTFDLPTALKALVDAAHLTVIMPKGLRVDLNGSGTFAVDLPATDDPDINPTGFSYVVTETFSNARGRTYSLPVPVGGSIDISQVVIAEAAPGFTTISGPPGVGVVSALAFGAIGDGSFDDSTGIQAGLDSLAGEGGGELLLPTGYVFAWDGPIYVPPGVSLISAGSGHKLSGQTKLLALSADASLIVGERGTVNQGGALRDLTIDGANLAHYPLKIGRAVTRHFENVTVMNSVLRGVTIEEAQNCKFDGIDILNSQGDGLVFDGGTGGHTFTRLEVGSFTGWGVKFQQSYDTTGDPELYFQPTHIDIDHAIIERSIGSGSADGCVFASAADRIKFRTPIFVQGNVVTSGATDEHALVVVDYDSANGATLAEVAVEDATFAGGGVNCAARIEAQSALFISGDNTRFQSCPTVLVANSGYANLSGRYVRASCPIWGGGSSSTDGIVDGIFYSHEFAPTRVSRPTDTQLAYAVHVDGEAFDRLQILASGLVQFGNGTAAPTAQLYLGADAHNIRTNMRLTGADGIVPLVKTGDVSDTDFAHTPPVGTFAVDSAGHVWVKFDGGWEAIDSSSAITSAIAAAIAAHIAATDPHGDRNYTDLQIAAAITGVFKDAGPLDCSANPNYPAASKGDAYVVTVAGKVGGASGTTVEVGDVVWATANNAGGTQAAVGASWSVLAHHLVGAVLAANNLSDIANPTTALANLGGVATTDSRLSDARTPTAHASSHVTGGSDVIPNAVAGGNSGLLSGSDKTKLDNQSGTNTGDQDLSSYAPKASPALTGNPTAPTQSAGDNSTKLATTAYADAAASTNSGSFAPTAVKTTTYTAAVNDLVPCDTTSGAFTVTLPSAPADKSRIAIKHVIQGGTNAVTVACGGSDVFNKAGGSTSLTLTLLNQALVLQYKASGGIWYVVADDLALGQLDSRYAAKSSAFTSLATALAGATVPKWSLDRLRAGVVPRTSVLNTSMDGSTTTMVTAFGSANSKGYLSQLGVATVVRIDDEEMLISASTAGQPPGTPGGTFTFTVTRGVNGTTAAAHTAGAKIRTDAVMNVCICGDSITYTIADDIRRDLDRRFGGLGLGFRGIWRGNEVGFATGIEWTFTGTAPTVATGVNDIGPWVVYSFASGSGNYATWTAPPEADIGQLDVYWVDTPGGTGNWSYSTDGGTTWVDNPNYPGSRPAAPTLMKSKIPVENPATLLLRAANAAGTGAAQLFSGVDVWSTRHEFGVTTGVKFHEFGYTGNTLANFAVADSGGDFGRIFDGDAASLVPMLVIIGPFSNDSAFSSATAAYATNLATVTNRVAGYADVLFLAVYDQDRETMTDVVRATTAALPSCTYANGTAGVGATLTATANGALSIDGGAPTVSQRVLVKNQASSFQNGPYTVTATGSAGAPFVLTRATDFDTAAEVLAGLRFNVTTGTTNGGTLQYVTSADSPTIGTGAITFSTTPTGSTYQANAIANRAAMTAAGASGGHAVLNLYDAYVAEGYVGWDACNTLNGSVSQPNGLMIDGAHPSTLGQRDIVARLSRVLTTF